MAFLCPVRIRRSKQQHNRQGSTKKPQIDHVSEYLDVSGGEGNTGAVLGRITGSSSVETLVRVGLEKEAAEGTSVRMLVLHDFDPCVDDELEVKRGEIVTVLYRENDWVYVIADKGREGFIPHTYCSPLSVKPDVVGTENTSTPGYSKNASGSAEIIQQNLNDSLSINQNLSSKDNSINSHVLSNPDVHPFYKDPFGQYIVLYKFAARDENDVSVERGELITVLNKDDPDWFWVVRPDGQEGFVPSAFVFPLMSQQSPSQESLVPKASNDVHLKDNDGPVIQHGSELVMLYDYKAQAPDDLSVRRGDWVYADLSHQTVEGWLWSYAPKQRKYGFIPKAYARPPAMTSL